MATEKEINDWVENFKPIINHWANAVGSNPFERKDCKFILVKRIILDGIKRRIISILEKKKPWKSWYQSGLLWALTSRNRMYVDSLDEIHTILLRQIDSEGKWHYPIDTVYKILHGVPLIYLANNIKDERLQNAIHRMFDSCNLLKKANNGSVLYIQGRDELFVDSLGMICPFLANYAVIYDSELAIDLCKIQLINFLNHNIDKDTHLPWHGYYASGPYKLGQCGWGRGVGWYLLALSEVLVAFDKFNFDINNLLKYELQNIIKTLRKYQHKDGHWGENILIKNSIPDSSATAFIAYSLLRCLNNKILEPTIIDIIEPAIYALKSSTLNNGWISDGSGEAYGLGSYALSRGVQPWTQGWGMAAAFEFCLFNKENRF